jgi:hypothetical protein
MLAHIISVRPPKQPLMVRTFLKVYMELGSYFLFLQEQIKDIIITCSQVPILGKELAFGQSSSDMLDGPDEGHNLCCSPPPFQCLALQPPEHCC